MYNNINRIPFFFQKTPEVMSVLFVIFKKKPFT